jgi:hypothetical protein
MSSDCGIYERTKILLESVYGRNNVLNTADYYYYYYYYYYYCSGCGCEELDLMIYNDMWSVQTQ